MPSVPFTGFRGQQEETPSLTRKEIETRIASYDPVVESPSDVEGIEYLTYAEIQKWIIPLLCPAPTIITGVYSNGERLALQRNLSPPFQKYIITHDGIICPANRILRHDDIPMLDIFYKRNKRRSNTVWNFDDTFPMVNLVSMYGTKHTCFVQDLIAHTFLPNPDRRFRSEYLEVMMENPTWRNHGFNDVLHLQNLQWEE